MLEEVIKPRAFIHSTIIMCKTNSIFLVLSFVPLSITRHRVWYVVDGDEVHSVIELTYKCTRLLAYINQNAVNRVLDKIVWGCWLIALCTLERVHRFISEGQFYDSYERLYMQHSLLKSKVTIIFEEVTIMSLNWREKTTTKRDCSLWYLNKSGTYRYVHIYLIIVTYSIMVML